MFLRTLNRELACAAAFVPLLFAVAAVSGQGQDVPASEIPVIRTDVRQVLVPFVVLDRRGRRIPGLKATDVQVFEDGAPEYVVTFNTVAFNTGNTLVRRRRKRCCIRAGKGGHGSRGGPGEHT